MPNLVVFRNPRFMLRRQFCNLPTLSHFELHRNFPNSYQLKHPTYNSCEEVTALELTIQRVSGISVPAIGYLAVWGQPGVSASLAQIERVLSLGTPRGGADLDQGTGTKRSTSQVIARIR